MLCPCCDYLSYLSFSLTVPRLCWYQGMYHTGSNVTREKVLHRLGVWEPGRQTSGRDHAFELSDNKGWENAGNIWAENRVSVTVCYSRFKTDRLLVTLESTESFSRVSLSKCGRLFPEFIQIRPKITSAQYLSDSDPGCDKRVQSLVSHGGLLTTGAVVSYCDHASGGDDPGGDHWPTSTMSRYRLQRLRQQQPHISRQSLQLGDHGILHNPYGFK